jgi:hypothetical protein
MILYMTKLSGFIEKDPARVGMVSENLTTTSVPVATSPVLALNESHVMTRGYDELYLCF